MSLSHASFPGLPRPLRDDTSWTPHVSMRNQTSVGSEFRLWVRHVWIDSSWLDVDTDQKLISNPQEDDTRKNERLQDQLTGCADVLPPSPDIRYNLWKTMETFNRREITRTSVHRKINISESSDTDITDTSYNRSEPRRGRRSKSSEKTSLIMSNDNLQMSRTVLRRHLWYSAIHNWRHQDVAYGRYWVIAWISTLIINKSISRSYETESLSSWWRRT